MISVIPAIISAVTDQSDGRRHTDAHDGRAVESSCELVIRAKRGEPDALDRLCERYLPRLRRWAHGRLPASSRGLLESQDLAQEVLFRAIERLDTFDPRHEKAFQAYLRQTLLNRLRDEARKGGRRPAQEPLGDLHAASDPSPLEAAIGQQAVHRYEAALNRLSDDDRGLIVARIELGFSAAELAAEFGKPTPAAAQMAVSRALLRLAQEMTHA